MGPLLLMACVQQPIPDPVLEPEQLVVASFNASLFRSSEGALRSELQSGTPLQVRQVASILQAIRPDVVLLNEVDFDPSGETYVALRERFFAVGQDGRDPLDLPYSYAPEVNTGVAAGVDLNDDGRVDDADTHGFGAFPGQYGFVVFSKFPLGTPRSFQRLLWADMPESRLPTEYYDESARDVLRLSSKNHLDLPVQVGAHTVRLLVSHPTPPAFDGPEDRNGRRNHDEIRLWTDYLSNADYLVDDAGVSGGLHSEASFVVLGDLNADPQDGDSSEAISALIAHERVNGSFVPSSSGGSAAAEDQGGANRAHRGDPAHDTADWSDGEVGNLRVDYALPSVDLRVDDSGVFWPSSGADLTLVQRASDHRAVWVKLTVGARE